MLRTIRYLFSICLILLSSNLIAQDFMVKNLTQYVDPFIGTGNTPRGGGCAFPGAMLPFGMVKLGPDNDLLTATAGYVEGKDIIGFSHVHASGTGGGPSYGNILIMPATGKIDVNNYSSPAGNETATPGYFSAFLKKYTIQCEMTATHSTGFHEYTMPASDTANVLLDAGHFLGLDTTYGEEQILVGSQVEIISDTEIQGYNRIRGGWNMAGAFTVYFYAKFYTPAKSFGTWKSGNIHPANKTEYDSGEKTGAYFTYTTTSNQKIKVKVAISYISCMKAKENMKNENDGW